MIKDFGCDRKDSPLFDLSPQINHESDPLRPCVHHRFRMGGGAATQGGVAAFTLCLLTSAPTPPSAPSELKNVIAG